MKYVKNFPFSLSTLLEVALEKSDKEDFFLALKIADKACRLTELPDTNALLVRASILSKLCNFADAIIDLKTAYLLNPSNQIICFTLLRLCQSV